MGLPPLQVYTLTPREFQNHANGYTERMRIEQRMEWERTRWLGWVIARGNGSKADSPKDLMLLEDEMPTEDQQKERMEALNRKFPKRWHGR